MGICKVSLCVFYVYSPGITSLSLLFAFKHATETLGLFLMCIFPLLFFFFYTYIWGYVFCLQKTFGAVFHLIVADANVVVHQTFECFDTETVWMVRSTICLFTRINDKLYVFTYDERLVSSLNTSWLATVHHWPVLQLFNSMTEQQGAMTETQKMKNWTSCHLKVELKPCNFSIQCQSCLVLSWRNQRGEKRFLKGIHSDCPAVCWGNCNLSKEQIHLA